MQKLSGTSSCFLLRIINDALLIVDQGRITFVNTKCEELCGYSGYELARDNTQLFRHKEECEAFFEFVRGYVAGNHARNEVVVEARHVRNGPFLANVVVHDYIDEDRSKKCVCVFSQLTFYKPLFELQSAVGIFEFLPEEEEGSLLRLNDAAVSFLGLGTDSYERKGLCRDCGVEFRSDDLKFFLAAPLETIHRFRSHIHASWLSFVVAPIGPSVRNRWLFAFVLEDVTRTTGLEARMEQAEHSLERQSSFFAKMVHELKSPLSGLLGISTLLQETVLTTEQASLLQTIESCGASMLTITGDLLDLTNLEHGTMRIVQKPFDLVQSLEEALDIASAQAALQEIELLYDVGRYWSIHLLGDGSRVKQIVLNLVSNAVKFTKTKGAAVVVRVRFSQPDQDGTVWTTFSVEDSGIGISDEALPYIFDEYFRVTTIEGVHQTEGSGLGLAVAKSLITIMGGNIQARSTEGVGTVVSFVLPFREMSTEIKPPIQLQGKKALVMSTRPLFVEDLRRRLEALGLVVLSNPPPESPDVVLYDYQLEEPPLLAHSALPTIYLAWSQLGCFGNHFLRKPLQSKALVELLGRIFNVTPTQTWVGQNPSRQEACFSRCFFKFLIVDDNITNRTILQRVLQTAGCTSTMIYTASNGSECLAFLEQQMVDIVLMDLEMPVLGGLEATKELRKRWPTRGKFVRPYIIGCSATGKEAKTRCVVAGMNGFLVKPVRYKSLVKAIRQGIVLLEEVNQPHTSSE